MFNICLSLAFNNNTDTAPRTIVKHQKRLSYYVSTLDVLYMVPEKVDDILTLNEAETFGGSFKKGWILPSVEPITLNLYLYYDGKNQEKLDTFFELNKESNEENSVIIIDDNEMSGDKEYEQFTPKADLYMYFTTETHCNEYKSHRPLEVTEKIGSNMYKAQLKDVSLVYSDKPYYICMQQFDTEFDSQLHDSKRFFSHQGDDYWNSILTTRSLLPTWSRVVIFFSLLCLSGLFSGLNLGLMSLDLSELEILKKIGTPDEQMYASKIYPLRSRGNFLLCSILLGNVLVNAVSTLILGDMVSGIYAALGSTFLIVIFGEIIPQAICSKHGLAIGAYTVYLMYFFMAVTSPLSFPISKFLDVILGQELATVYGRDKIRELLRNVEDIGDKEFKIITGALDFNKKKVKDVMTSLEEVFMLELNDRLDFETIAKIAGHGFSRIPVYESKRDNIIGLLHVKDFTLLDPDDNMPVKAILEFYNHKIIFCYSDKLIDEMFEEFRMGETHLAFVTEVVQQDDQDPYVLCVGIITLEDILEELVQMEIYDEFDNKSQIEKEELESQKHLVSIKYHVDSDTDSKSKVVTPTSSLKFIKANHPKTGSSPAKGNHLELKELANNIRNSMKKSKEYKQDLAKKLTPNNYETQTSHDLSFFIQQERDTIKNGQSALISSQIRFVMFQFLWTTVKPFTIEFLTKNVLELIFKRCSLIETKRPDRKSPPEYLYNYGRGCDYFILILSGEATIEVGKEKLEFPAGPFAYFGVNALLAGSDTAEEVLQEESKLKENESKNVFFNEAKQTNKRYYVPDFSLRVDDRCVYMKLDRELWRNGVIKSRYEIQNNQLSDHIDYNPPSENPVSQMGSISSTSNSKFDFGSYQASPSQNSMVKITNGKYSLAVADALAKAQQKQKDLKMTKSHSNTKLPAMISQPRSTDPLLHKSLSTNSVKGLERRSSSVSVDMNSNDKEPFLKE